MRLLALGMVLSAFLLAAQADAGEPVGQVSRIVGTVTATGESGATGLAGGSPIHTDDVVATADASKVEIGFVDGTKVTIGERAELRIDSFVYTPAGLANAVELAVSGPFRYVSGAIGGGHEGSARVVTPVATIGLRGTDFWGGLVDERFGVFLIAGSVTVTTAAGVVVLDAPGQGSDVAAPDVAPGPVTIWPQDKVLRALATVVIP